MGEGAQAGGLPRGAQSTEAHDTATSPSKSKARSVAIFGAGIAGLSAAHELARRGWTVDVYEALGEAGGFFRSARHHDQHHIPSEYSWHGMGPWYHNLFDLLKQIPFDERGSMFDRALSRPINFGLAPNEGTAAFDDTPLLNVKNLFRMKWLDVVRGSWLMLKTWASNRRTMEHYARLSASEQWKSRLSEQAWKSWRSSFGPWIGSDWCNVSLHTAGLFFRKQLMSGAVHHHKQDDEGPAWVHKSRSGWLLLRGPSSEYWFDRWVAHLRRERVNFHFGEPLHRLNYDGSTITGAETESGTRVVADVYILATSPFAAADVLRRTPDLARLEQLRLFEPLIQDGPHVQVSFRIAFSERINWPRERTALIVSDSEFNLTIFAQEQAWHPDVFLGDGVKSLWTGTACVSAMPGPVHGLPLAQCTREQFLEEVHAQLLACESLQDLIRQANGGRSLSCFPIKMLEVWHEWQFSAQGIKQQHPKWVTTTRTQSHQPTQSTPVPNLLLAGAHTKTDADVWSIEGAVESGRRAAKVVEPGVSVIPQYKALWLRMLGKLDDICFTLGLPHVLDMGIALILMVAAVWLVLALM